MNKLFLYLSLCGALLLLALSGCKGIFDFKSDDEPLFGVEWDLHVLSINDEQMLIYAGINL